MNHLSSPVICIRKSSSRYTIRKYTIFDARCRRANFRINLLGSQIVKSPKRQGNHNRRRSLALREVNSISVSDIAPPSTTTRNHRISPSQNPPRLSTFLPRHQQIERWMPHHISMSSMWHRPLPLTGVSKSLPDWMRRVAYLRIP